MLRPGGLSASKASRALLNRLSGWFGLAEANRACADGVAERTCFLVGAPEVPLGLLALDIHFARTAETWLMAVDPAHHRQGVGKALVDAAIGEAYSVGCAVMAVSTLSPRNPDPGCAATRAFYEALGFRPFVEVNRNDAINPMVWMDREIAQV